MGLFDKFRSTSRTNSPFTLEEATSGVLLGVMGVDGHISDEETDLFRLIVNRHSIFRDQPAIAFNQMIDKMLGILKREGWKAMVDKCAVDLPPEMRPCIFALAVDFVLADGSVEEEENRLIAHLQAALGIPEEDASIMVRTLAIKNGM